MRTRLSGALHRIARADAVARRSRSQRARPLASRPVGTEAARDHEPGSRNQLQAARAGAGQSVGRVRAQRQRVLRSGELPGGVGRDGRPTRLPLGVAGYLGRTAGVPHPGPHTERRLRPTSTGSSVRSNRSSQACAPRTKARPTRRMEPRPLARGCVLVLPRRPVHRLRRVRETARGQPLLLR